MSEEVWVELPDRGVRISSLMNVQSLRTGNFLKVRETNFWRWVKLPWKAGHKQAGINALMAEAGFGSVDRRSQRVRNPRPARTYRPKRRENKPRSSVAKTSKYNVPVPIEGSFPWADPVWREADAVVPKGLSYDVRLDLISDMVLMRLEGMALDMREAYKVARRARSKMMGTFKESSLDVLVPGTDRLRLIDTLTSDCEHL